MCGGSCYNLTDIYLGSWGCFLGRVDILALKLLISLSIAGSISTAFAGSTLPNCVIGNLATYENLTANPPSTGGCALGVLDYYNFNYLPGSNAPAASAIGVAPEGTGFSFGPVTAAPGQTVQFEIDYDLFIDPAPIITGDKLGLDPPTGNVVVTEYFCNDVSYVGGGLCLGSRPAPSLTVGTPGTGFPSSASIVFNPPAMVSEEVGIVFTLTGGTTGASFDGLDSTSVVLYAAPEPPAAASLSLGIGLLAVAIVGRRRARRQGPQL
jgi:hypothetical protein